MLIQPSRLIRNINEKPSPKGVWKTLKSCNSSCQKHCGMGWCPLRRRTESFSFYGTPPPSCHPAKPLGFVKGAKCRFERKCLDVFCEKEAWHLHWKEIAWRLLTQSSDDNNTRPPPLCHPYFGSAFQNRGSAKIKFLNQKIALLKVRRMSHII